MIFSVFSCRPIPQMHAPIVLYVFTSIQSNYFKHSISNIAKHKNAFNTHTSNSVFAHHYLLHRIAFMNKQTEYKQFDNFLPNLHKIPKMHFSQIGYCAHWGCILDDFRIFIRINNCCTNCPRFNVQTNECWWKSKCTQTKVLLESISNRFERKLFK